MNGAARRTLSLLLVTLSIGGCGDDGEPKELVDSAVNTTPDGGGAADAGDAGTEEPLRTLDRSRFKDVGTSAPLDYSVPEMWVCRPDIEPNECKKSLDASEVKSDATYAPEAHKFAENPEFDCFYVYPTVLLSGAPQMVDFSNDGVTLVNDALMTQGARFSSMCKMYAPLYRQVGLSGGMVVQGSNPALGLQDVRDAFKYYLEHLNKGRKFVLIGHSQGTSMLTLLTQMDIDDKPEVRARLISALLIGFAVEVPPGQLVGGTFKNIPVCSSPGQVGCVITYASFASDKLPDMTARFGRTMKPGMQVACVNPATLANNPGRFRASYFRKSIANASFKPDMPLPEDLPSPFAIYKDVLKGECATEGDANFLKITLETPAGDKRTPPWRQMTVEGIGFGLHLVDYQVALGDLLEAVKLQADAALP